LGINENSKNSNAKNIEKKRIYYDTLASEINIDGITEIVRDTAFDDTARYNSGGIRLLYNRITSPIEGVKEGILLEAGYDNVVPNVPVTISSWAYERGRQVLELDLIDNRAVDIICYDHRYTFVEKLQTIAAKFRKEIEKGEVATNYMRQYYDVYCLLDDKAVQEFIGTDAYLTHKKLRFSEKDFALPIHQNEAFLLSDASLREAFRQRYESSKKLYYKGQPTFDEVLGRITDFREKL
jgi:hypothetical protein